MIDTLKYHIDLHVIIIDHKLPPEFIINFRQLSLALSSSASWGQSTRDASLNEGPTNVGSSQHSKKKTRVSTESCTISRDLFLLKETSNKKINERKDAIRRRCQSASHATRASLDEKRGLVRNLALDFCQSKYVLLRNQASKWGL